ncbi:MAG: hypothetical protein U0794_08815 [Isosphaeraceae bacterium]
MIRRVPDLSKIGRLVEYRPTSGNLDQILHDILEEQQSLRGRQRPSRSTALRSWLSMGERMKPESEGAT